MGCRKITAEIIPFGGILLANSSANTRQEPARVISEREIFTDFLLALGGVFFIQLYYEKNILLLSSLWH